MPQITSAGCHAPSVISCRCLWSESEFSEKLPNSKSISVLSGHAIGLQGNESYPHGRQKVLQTTLAKFQVHCKLPFISFLRLAGRLTAASSVIQLGLLHLRPFQHWLIAKCLSPIHNLRTLVWVTTSCAVSLRLWRREKFLRRGVPIGLPPARSEVVTTYAFPQQVGRTLTAPRAGGTHS